MRIGRGAGGRVIGLAVLVVALSCGALAARAESGPAPSRGAARPAVAPRIAARPTEVAATIWRWPLPGQPQVTREFRPPKTAYGPGHRGVDLAGTIGESVRAAGPGVIGFAGQFAGRGVITVHHPGGLETTYEPVTAVVRARATIGPGDLLGRLEPGHPGCPVAACLHWGLRRGAVYLDPLLLVRPVRVRLLPLPG
jgi:murein DD-endopeptidase MepM/ murein hydrolase activator NlpD